MPVSGLELLGKVHGVVDEGEASRLAAAELGLEAECEATISSARVHLCQLLPHLGLNLMRTKNSIDRITRYFQSKMRRIFCIFYDDCTHISLGHCSLAWVENVNHHLTPENTISVESQKTQV